ncbi:MAG: sigma-54-dependent Fis family transcriptional regulator [Gemmatimonadaceae bacterium]|nr:sigma-54-dependent Fis family transcriptional regulator [Gemmatimonadaceae bacterium]
MPTVLIIDDEPNIRRMVGALLAAEGYDVRDADTGAAGLARARDVDPDVILLDLMIPGELDGIETLALLRDAAPDSPVVMMSGRAGLDDAVKAMKLGAFNFLEKPLSPEGVLLALGSALELRSARREARALREDLGLNVEMVGNSPAIAQLRALIARVAPTDSRVLITGESGTGKELVASAIHAGSGRRDRPFVRVNCAAIPRDLVESEMFGHERGAFTGATDKRIGRFELAHTGTLFLDEVGDLGADAQAKLLRAIEAGEIERLGGGKPIRIDVRIIAATNRDLPRAVADGSFREDLFFRLNVIPIVVPPLRDRPTDIPALVAHFASLHRRRTGHPAVTWSSDAVARLEQQRWPGNIRELANIVERIAILHAGTEVRENDIRAVLPEQGHAAAAGSASLPAPSQLDQPLTETLDAYERTLIMRALSSTSGNVAEAARRLRTDRPNLYRRMRRLGIPIGDEIPAAE